MRPRAYGGDIDPRIVEQMLRIGERGGAPRAAILRGLPVGLGDGMIPREDVAWETYLTVVARVHDGVGGPSALVRAANDLPGLTPELNPMLGVFGSTREVLDFWFSTLNPRLWRCMRFRTRDLPDGRTLVTIDTPQGRPPGTHVLVATCGSLRSIPRRVGLEDADMECRLSSPRRAEYILRLPTLRPRTLRQRLAALEAFKTFALAELGAYASDVAQLARGEPPESNEDDALADAQARWNLTARQRDVLLWIVRGLSNKEIAGELGCAEVTIERHATAIFQKANARGRANLITKFWRG